MTKFMNSKEGMNACITTASGKEFWYTSADIDSISIGDIASALSKICRFSGHCSRFYSVAEHSYWTSFLVAPEHALAALLHDASEAYCADIPSPLKQLLPDYKLQEDRVMFRIADKFGLPDEFWKSKEVKEADWAQLKTEAHYLLPTQGANWSFPEGLREGMIPYCWTPEKAYSKFMMRWAELQK